MKTIKEGAKAPSFKLQGSDGKTYQLADLAGKYLIVYFYPKDDTPGCTKEACGFSALSEDFASINAVIVGISKDGRDSHQAFIKKFKLPFLLLSDPDYSMMTTYGAYGEKVLYGKKTIGVIRSTVLIGPDGRVLKHWKRVPDAAKHPAQVHEWLNKFLSACATSRA